MVATLVAGSRYGYGLLWAVILGVILKIILVEGAGRYTLATGKTIFEGWRSLGIWTTWYFGPYIMIWGFVYGATAMSSAALPLAALFPAVDLKIWAVLMGLAGFAMVWFGKYEFFEKITAALVGIMFVTVVGLAVIAVPNLPDMLRGLVPMIPGRRHALHPGAGRRRRRHHHAGGLRLLAARKRLVHAQVDEGHAHRQHRGLCDDRHLRDLDADCRRRGGALGRCLPQRRRRRPARPARRC